MSESWRDILENAAGKLSIELEPIAAPAYSSAAAASFGPRRLSPQLSFAESCELLARELQAISVQSRKPRPPAPNSRPDERSPFPSRRQIRRSSLSASRESVGHGRLFSRRSCWPQSRAAWRRICFWLMEGSAKKRFWRWPGMSIKVFDLSARPAAKLSPPSPRGS